MLLSIYYVTRFVTYQYMNKEKNLSLIASQGLNLGLPNPSQMIIPLSHKHIEKLYRKSNECSLYAHYQLQVF